MHAVLPEFVAPMLAKPGPAFDSDEHLFEIKWDGTRALAFVESSGYALKNRRGEDLAERFPELACVGALPPGVVLDGEIVVVTEGRVDFPAAMSRLQARGELRVRVLARKTPAVYAVFDLLYQGHRSCLDRPLVERRRALADLLDRAREPALVFSDGMVGGGLAFFDEVTSRGFEGVVAKRLSSRYEPGRRSGAWTKCKRVQELLCAIVGYLPEGRDDLKSLILAADDQGSLRCVGKVASGLTAGMRRDLARRLASRSRAEPLVPCDFPGSWVEPGLFCTVRFLERTRGGMLRSPVFLGLVEDAGS